MAAPRQGLSDSQVEKALGAIQYLSSLQIPSENTSVANTDRTDATSSVESSTSGAAQVDGKGIQYKIHHHIKTISKHRI